VDQHIISPTFSLITNAFIFPVFLLDLMLLSYCRLRLNLTIFHLLEDPPTHSLLLRTNCSCFRLLMIKRTVLSLRLSPLSRYAELAVPLACITFFPPFLPLQIRPCPDFSFHPLLPLFSPYIFLSYPSFFFSFHNLFDMLHPLLIRYLHNKI